MKTTIKTIGLLLLIPFGLNSQQNAQASVTFEAYIDTTYAFEGTSNKINYVYLSKKEIEKINEHLKQFFTDSNNAYYSALISNTEILSDFKNINKYIKSNNEYLKPFGGANHYNDNYTKGTKSFLSFNENWTYINGKIIKENTTSGIAKPVFRKNNEFRGHMNIYTKLIKQKSIKKELFKKNVEYDFWFYPYVMDKENEQCFTDCKYNNDIKEMIIQTTSERINGLSQFEIKNLLTPIITDIYSGRLKIHDLKENLIPTDNLDKLFSFKKRIKEFDEKGNLIYDDKGEIKTNLINNSYEVSDIIGINFTEYWHLASNQFDIIKEVKSISFLVNDYNDKGEIIGTKKLPCIIKFTN